MSIKILLGSIFALVVGTACSSTRFAYDNASIFVIPMIHDVTDFNSEQKEMISAKFREYMKTHRKWVLPKYVKFLDLAIDSVDKKATVASARLMREELMKALYATVEPGVEPAADVLLTLTPDQIDEMEKRYRAKVENEKKKKLSGTPEEIADERAKRFLDFYENWVGDLSSEQKKHLGALHRQLPHATETWFKYRDEKNGELFALLRTRPTRTKLVGFLKDWWLHPPKPKDPRDRRTLENFLAKTDEFFLKLKESMTLEQREYVKKRFKKFRDDFAEIHEDNKA